MIELTCRLCFKTFFSIDDDCIKDYCKDCRDQDLYHDPCGVVEEEEEEEK